MSNESQRVTKLEPQKRGRNTLVLNKISKLTLFKSIFLVFFVMVFLIGCDRMQVVHLLDRDNNPVYCEGAKEFYAVVYFFYKTGAGFSYESGFHEGAVRFGIVSNYLNSLKAFRVVVYCGQNRTLYYDTGEINSSSLYKIDDWNYRLKMM